MPLTFRHRLFLALVGMGTLPVAAALLVLALQMRSAASASGYRVALDSIAASSGRLLATFDTMALESAGRAALREHATIVSGHVRMAGQAETLTRAKGALTALLTLAVAGIVVGASLLLARRWSRDVSSPIEELVDWVGRIERREPLPPTQTGGAPEFAALRAALRELAGALDRARRQELDQERLRAFRETARHVAHEMRAPLGALRLAVRQLGEPSAAAEVLADETARLEAMAREFSEFGRLPEGPAAPVEMGELIERVLAGCVPPSCPVERNVEPALLVQGHYEPLRRAVENLVRNAVAFTGERGIAVTARRGSGTVEVRVRDHGPGVAPEMTERIFEPYFTTRHEGTGLGLALVRQTAAAHGGSVRVTGAPDGGAEFVLALPEGG